MKTHAHLELLHIDIWGLALLTSGGGYKYYLSLVDDYTRYIWMFPIKNKCESTRKILIFQIQIERSLEKRVKCLQSGWGGEFEPLKEHLKRKGIIFRHSWPYTLMQNGKVKGKHQYIVEITLTSLVQAYMPMKL